MKPKKKGVKDDRRVLVQTLLPPALGRWVKKESKREGISIAAFVRRALMDKRASSIDAEEGDDRATLEEMAANS